MLFPSAVGTGQILPSWRAVITTSSGANPSEIGTLTKPNILICSQYIPNKKVVYFGRMFDRSSRKEVTLEASREVAKPKTMLKPRKVTNLHRISVFFSMIDLYLKNEIFIFNF